MSATHSVHHHPLFARVWARLAGLGEHTGLAEHRERLLEGLSGRVVEVGAGSGTNFVHYPASVTSVVAVEPEPYLRTLAEEAARHAPVEIEVVGGIAEDLPLVDGEADAAVASLVLCSVEDPAAALAEMRRVVRVGGELRFYEHVRSPSASAARLQRAADVLWPRIAGGCHTSRDTVAAIEKAGWELGEHRRFSFRPGHVPLPVSPHAAGRAVAAES